MPRKKKRVTPAKKEQELKAKVRKEKNYFDHLDKELDEITKKYHHSYEVWRACLEYSNPVRANHMKRAHIWYGEDWDAVEQQRIAQHAKLKRAKKKLEDYQKSKHETLSPNSNTQPSTYNGKEEVD